jgi:hypothetical protein
MKVFLGGEGNTELGSDDARGVLEALFAKATGQSFELVGVTTWKDIVKFQPGKKRGEEARNVLGVVLAALEAGADVVAFVRDRDGEKDREREICAAIDEARGFGWNVTIVGGVPVEKMESWILAIQGKAKIEAVSRSKAKATLKRAGIATIAEMVDLIDAADLDRIPEDAASLRKWIEHAKACGSPET